MAFVGRLCTNFQLPSVFLVLDIFLAKKVKNMLKLLQKCSRHTKLLRKRRWEYRETAVHHKQRSPFRQVTHIYKAYRHQHLSKHSKHQKDPQNSVLVHTKHIWKWIHKTYMKMDSTWCFKLNGTIKTHTWGLLVLISTKTTRN